MESFGKILKQAREDQGFSLEDLASLTRIQENYLQALEEDRFEAMPQQVFARGFVRTYARALNMDEVEVMRQFAVASGSHYQHEEEEQEHAKQQIEESRKGKANRNIVVVLIGLVLIGLLFVLPQEQSTTSVSDRPTTTQSKAVPISDSKSVTDDPRKSTDDLSGSATKTKSNEKPLPQKKTTNNRESGAPKPVIAAKPTPKPPVTPTASSIPATPERSVTNPVSENVESGADDSIILNLEASEITWVVVSVDDGDPLEALLQPGEKVQWHAQDHFIVTLGNAGGVKVHVDGKPRGPFGKPGTVVRDVMIRR